MVTSYLVSGLLSSSTSLLVEGFSISTTTIKLVFYLNNFKLTKISSISYIRLIKLKVNTVSTKNSVITFNLSKSNKLYKYKINSNYLNKLNVN